MSRSAVRVLIMLAALVAAPLAVAPAAQAQDAPDCTVHYEVIYEGPATFVAEVTVTVGGLPASDWRASFTYTAGQEVTGGYNGNITISGDTVTVSTLAWNGTPGTGPSTVGILGTHDGKNPPPEDFQCAGW